MSLGYIISGIIDMMTDEDNYSQEVDKIISELEINIDFLKDAIVNQDEKLLVFSEDFKYVKWHSTISVNIDYHDNVLVVSVDDGIDITIKNPTNKKINIIKNLLNMSSGLFDFLDEDQDSVDLSKYVLNEKFKHSYDHRQCDEVIHKSSIYYCVEHEIEFIEVV